jgi:hypothetical protein
MGFKINDTSSGAGRKGFPSVTVHGNEVEHKQTSYRQGENICKLHIQQIEKFKI